MLPWRYSRTFSVGFNTREQGGYACSAMLPDTRGPDSAPVVQRGLQRTRAGHPMHLDGQPDHAFGDVVRQQSPFPSPCFFVIFVLITLPYGSAHHPDDADPLNPGGRAASPRASSNGLFFQRVFNTEKTKDHEGHGGVHGTNRRIPSFTSSAWKSNIGPNLGPLMRGQVCIRARASATLLSFSVLLRDLRVDCFSGRKHEPPGRHRAPEPEPPPKPVGSGVHRSPGNPARATVGPIGRRSPPLGRPAEPTRGVYAPPSMG